MSQQVNYFPWQTFCENKDLLFFSLLPHLSVEDICFLRDTNGVIRKAIDGKSKEFFEGIDRSFKNDQTVMPITKPLLVATFPFSGWPHFKKEREERILFFAQFKNIRQLLNKPSLQNSYIERNLIARVSTAYQGLHDALSQRARNKRQTKWVYKMGQTIDSVIELKLYDIALKFLDKMPKGQTKQKRVIKIIHSFAKTKKTIGRAITMTQEKTCGVEMMGVYRVIWPHIIQFLSMDEMFEVVKQIGPGQHWIILDHELFKTVSNYIEKREFETAKKVTSYFIQVLHPSSAFLPRLIAYLNEQNLTELDLPQVIRDEVEKRKDISPGTKATIYYQSCRLALKTQRTENLNVWMKKIENFQKVLLVQEYPEICSTPATPVLKKQKNK